jgi:putative transposase
MDDHESLSCTKWEGKYHVVFIPKRRRKTFYAELRKYGRGVSKACRAEREPDRGGSFDAGPRAYVDLDPAEVFGFAGDRLHQRKKRDSHVYGEKKRNFVGQHFWARGYFVSTVGRDEDVIRQYIKNHEAEDKRLDQPRLWT